MSHIISKALLHAVFVSHHAPDLFDGQSTHEPALRYVGQLVRFADDDELIQRIVIAALPPNYAGDTLKELSGMIASARRKGFDQPSDGRRTQASKKSSIAQQVIDAVGGEIELFRVEARAAYMWVGTEVGGRRCYPILGRDCELFIREKYFRDTGGSLPKNAREEILLTLESMAIFGGQIRSVYQRVGRVADKIYIDLGTDDGGVVQMDSLGWRVLVNSPIAFTRDEGLRALPTPQRGGSIDVLKKLLGLDDKNWILLLGFLLNCLRGDAPFMCLIVEGQQGSGKSFLCEAIKRIIDPNSLARMRLPENEHELMVQAKNYFLLVFDNASGMRGDLSDALCTLSTGGGFARRRLYTDQDLSVIAVARPFIINGIGEFVTRPDLLERAIPLQLTALDDRRTERELLDALERHLPEILGALYDAVAMALRDLDAVAAPKNIRMIDVARWVTAAEPALGLSRGAFVATLADIQSDINVERINNEPLVIKLHLVVAEGAFFGTVAELFADCCPSETFTYGLPRTPAQLSKLLKRLAPALTQAGIFVRFETKTKHGQPVRIWRDGHSPDALRKPRQLY